MANYIAKYSPDLEEKVFLMQQDARFDVADNTGAPELSIMEEIRSPKALPKVPKVFLSNDCLFNCAYCGCRSERDCKRAYTCTPAELAELSVKQAAGGKHGIFLSSAIYKTPDYTMELMVETMKIIRGPLGYGGYLHSKVMPGTSPELIMQAGLYADRLSVNIEVAKSEGYQRVAKNKNKRNILTPMGQISEMIKSAGEAGGRGRFATSQTTQLMAGSAGEDDHTILNLSGALYNKYRLKRVYYTSFQYREPAVGYDGLPLTQTPTWRMHRLYQADRLMQLYGFTADEITPDDSPNLAPELDPKAAWALRNLHLFPIEVNTADYEMLLRIPGIGVTYAKRILKARKYCTISLDTLKALGVSLARSRHFLTCRGKYAGYRSDNQDRLRLLLLDPKGVEATQLSFYQMAL